MASIHADPNAPGAVLDDRPLSERYKHAQHFRSKEEEFDACKLGMWLFLSTEVLLFGGIFCAYAIFRVLYPRVFQIGSSYLDWRWGGLNTVVLLISSYTMAISIHHAQRNNQRMLKLNLIVTMVLGMLFVAIKLLFEYIPKWSGWQFNPTFASHGDVETKLGGLFWYLEGYGGKRPGVLFNYPFAVDPNENLWWSIYYSGTAIHAFHVICGVALIYWVYRKACKGAYGPAHYTGVEVVGLYWHIVDLIWIFLFPLLYLIH